jgi:hypothetical protein
MNWITGHYPQEKGDYLWVTMWGCNCCVRKSGIAWITDVEGADPENMPAINYKTHDGKHLGIYWEGTEPPFIGSSPTKPDIDGWLKVSLPKHKREK